MIYEFTSLHAMSEALRRMGEAATAGPATATSMSVRAGWNAAARVVSMAVLDNPPVVDEYARAYSDAQVTAGIYIWASMQRFKGDPTWQPDALVGWMQQ